MLSTVLGVRLSALFIREERPAPSAALLAQADENEVALRLLARPVEANFVHKSLLANSLAKMHANLHEAN